MNLLLLSATLLALLSGPLLYGAARERPAVLAFLDGFVLVAISGLVMLEVLPDTLQSGGYASLVFLALGALGPSLLEHQLHHAKRAHVAALVLAMAGLVLHSIGDGTALAPLPGAAAGGDEPNIALALAIAVHSVPVGLMVWWLLYPVFGALFPALAIAAMCLGTIIGYAYAGPVSGWLGATGWAWLQALVAGSILHVVFGRPHLGDTSAHRIARPPFEGLGNLAALAALILLENLHPEGHHSHQGFLDRLIDLARQVAPVLMLAWIGGSLHAHSQRRVKPTRSRLGGLLSGLLQSESGEPLPEHLLRTNAGVPLPASLAWLTGASLLGLSVLLVGWPLLGWQLATARAAAALLIAMLVALPLAWLFRDAPLRVFRPMAAGAARFTPMTPAAAPLSVPPPKRIDNSVRGYLLARVDRDAPWLLAGLLFAALAAPWLQQAPWTSLPLLLQLPLFAVLGLAFAGNPLAATPIAALLMASGLGSGPVLVFLLVGPLLSPALLAGLARMHGRALATGFGAVSLVSSLAIGLAAQKLLPAGSLPLSSSGSTIANLQTLPLLAVCLLTAHSLLRRGGRQFFGMLLKYVNHSHDHH
ncbi:permease [Hydrocarboniphaga sp.]|uniref:permease n=1 Tax=Hydrocarboniphaga sp. TaxID=2033016 RepID=UPI00262E858E|nr:permease [Hydrocarboniphaga sp.]